MFKKIQPKIRKNNLYKISSNYLKYDNQLVIFVNLLYLYFSKQLTKSIYIYKVRKFKLLYRVQFNRMIKSNQYWVEDSYYGKVKSRFLSEIKNIVQKNNLTDLILVVDNLTMITVSNLFTIPELVKQSVTFIERLELQRKKLDHHALYFITPTSINIDRLLNDFKDKENPHYKKIHIFFTTFLHQDQLKKIAASKTLVKKISKNSIKQFYHSVTIFQYNTIVLDVQYMKIAFSKESKEQEICRVKMVRKLVEILANVGELNTVRIYYKKQKNMISQRIANLMNTTAKQFLGTLLQNKSNIITKNAKDVTLLIMDRSVDPVTPLLHSFTYQSLLFDLIKVSYQGKNELKDKQYYSFEEIQDEIYEQYRYEHISKALQELPKQLDSFKVKMQTMKGKDGIDLQELTQNMKNLKKHIDMVSLIWQKFKEKNLTKVGQLEYSLATGVDENGKQTSSGVLIEQVNKIMHEGIINNDQRLRLALLALCCIKMSKKDYESIFNLFNDDDKKALKNIAALGISYDSSVSKSTKAVSKQQQTFAIQRLKQKQMALDRYSTILQLILPMVVRVLRGQDEIKTLDTQIFGCVECSPFPINEERFDVSKFTLMMCGGLSYAELSSLRRLKQTKNIIIATDQLLNPQTYINNLRKIDILDQN